MVCCFCFQAEDGIRDLIVTGVQTCALPISQYSPGRDDVLPRAGDVDRIGPAWDGVMARAAVLLHVAQCAAGDRVLQDSAPTGGWRRGVRRTLRRPMRNPFSGLRTPGGPSAGGRRL